MRHRPLRATSKGLTLIELLVVVAITGMLFVVLMTFTANAIVSTSTESARASLLQDAQIGLDTIGRDIRLSANAEDNNRWPDNNAPSAPGNKFSWESDAHTLVLATAAMKADRTILFEDPLNYVTYKNNSIFFVQNGILYKRTVAANIANNSAQTTCPKASATTSCLADRILMNNVKTFTVQYYSGENAEVSPPDARSIKLTVQLETKKYGKTITANYVTRMVFRNE